MESLYSMTERYMQSMQVHLIQTRVVHSQRFQQQNSSQISIIFIYVALVMSAMSCPSNGQ